MITTFRDKDYNIIQRLNALEDLLEIGMDEKNLNNTMKILEDINRMKIESLEVANNLKRLIKTAHQKFGNSYENNPSSPLMILADVAGNLSQLSNLDESTNQSQSSSGISKVGCEDTSMDSSNIDMKKKKKNVTKKVPTKKKSSKKSKKNDDEFDEASDLFCLCNRPSFGSMIECSNEACVYEWFHFSCIGLKKRVPKGKWYCPKCRSGVNRPTMLKKEYRRGNI